MNSRIIELMCQFSGMVHDPTPPGAAPVGELDLDRLWQAAPGWRAAVEESRPDPEVVAELRACSTPTVLRFAFGTWCHLSQQYLPPLLRALEEAGNPHLELRLIGIDESFAEPAGAIQALGLINVPTLIATQESGEVGRVIETPAGESLEGDLAAILSRRPRRHPGRWVRGPLLRHGVYARGDGREEWWLYSLPHGGRLLRSAIDLPGERIEVWQRTAGSGRPELLEVTQEREEGALRSRCLVDGPRLTAWLRGPASGTVRQSLALPEGAAFATPSLLSLAWGWRQGRAGDGGAVPLYLTPVDPRLSLGVLLPARYARIGETSVDSPAGALPATGLACTVAGRQCELWLGPEDGVPLHGRDLEGRPYRLTSLTGNGDRAWQL